MEIDNNIEIIERINKFRETKNLSQTKFGEEIGFSQSRINEVLSGKHPISNKMLIAICYRYALSMSWLKTGEGEIYSNENIDREYVISLFDDLDIVSQKFILKIIEILHLYPHLMNKNIDSNNI